MGKYTPLLLILALFLFTALVAQNYDYIFGSYAVCNSVIQQWGTESDCKSYPNLFGSITGFIGVSQNNTTTSNVTIGTAAPIITPVTLEDNATFPDDRIDLWGGLSRSIWCNATVTDNNGGANFNGTVANATIFDSNVTDYGASCNASIPGTWDNNMCYLAPNSTYSSNCVWGNRINETSQYLNCTIGDGTSGGMWYSANKTRNLTKRWNCTIRITDTDSNTSFGSDQANVSELLAVGVPTWLDFGTMSADSTSTNDVNHSLTNYGNINITFRLNGTDMPCSGTGSVPVGKVHYNCTAAGANPNYDTEMANLTTSPNDNVNCSGRNATNITKTYTAQGIPATSNKNITWKIRIPSPPISGLCQGTIWYIALASSNW